MNTKIIVALVLGIALIGLTGSASASYIDTYTDIRATHFSSISRLSTSGMDMDSTYSQSLVGDLVYPTYPPVDMAWSATRLRGRDYGIKSNIRSSLTGSEVEVRVSNADKVNGKTSFWNCALWGQGVGPRAFSYPTEEEVSGIRWTSSHPAGSAYPTHSVERHNIYWP